jgi:hypothetical protein
MLSHPPLNGGLNMISRSVMPLPTGAHKPPSPKTHSIRSALVMA